MSQAQMRDSADANKRRCTWCIHTKACAPGLPCRGCGVVPPVRRGGGGGGGTPSVRTRADSSRRASETEAVTLSISPGRLGLTFRVTSKLGAIIVGIDPACTLRHAKKGDRIVEIDGKRVKHVRDLAPKKGSEGKVRWFKIVKKRRKAESGVCVHQSNPSTDGGKFGKVLGENKKRREGIKPTSSSGLRLTSEGMFMREERVGGNRLWRCLVCRRPTFKSYRDCMEHERTCRGRGRAKSPTSLVWQCEVCREAEYADYDDCVAHEKQCTIKQVHPKEKASEGESIASRKRKGAEDTGPAKRSFEVGKSLQKVTKGHIMKKTDTTERPSDLDVLSGRGSSCTYHAGNLRFRDEVKKMRGAFNDVHIDTRCSDRFSLSWELVMRVKNYGGRFLARADDGLWYEMDDERARKKAAQALRENW